MEKQWYIIHTYSGFEKKVKESLESRVAAFGLQDKIGRMMIPTEDVLEVRGGKKVISSRMLAEGARRNHGGARGARAIAAANPAASLLKGSAARPPRPPGPGPCPTLDAAKWSSALRLW